MTPFTRKDSLAAAVTSTVEKHRNMTLKEYLEETTNASSLTRSSPQMFNFGNHYVENPGNVQNINAFIKRFLSGTHIEPETILQQLFMHLQSIGLVVSGYKGKDGTFDIDQFGKPIDDKPISGYEETDNFYFPRRNVGGKIKIGRSLQPGGRYLIDAEIYITKK